MILKIITASIIMVFLLCMFMLCGIMSYVLDRKMDAKERSAYIKSGVFYLCVLFYLSVLLGWIGVI